MFTVSEKLILFILLGLILDQIFTYIISKALVYSDTCVSYMYRHEGQSIFTLTFAALHSWH